MAQDVDFTEVDKTYSSLMSKCRTMKSTIEKRCECPIQDEERKEIERAYMMISCAEAVLLHAKSVACWIPNEP